MILRNTISSGEENGTRQMEPGEGLIQIWHVDDNANYRDLLMELLDLADAYIAIGNSTGTLAEVAMAWDYMTKGFLPPKPMLLIGESWRRFMEYIEREDQFLPFLHFTQYHSDIEGAIGSLETIFGASLHLPDLDILSTDQ